MVTGFSPITSGRLITKFALFLTGVSIPVTFKDKTPLSLNTLPLIGSNSAIMLIRSPRMLAGL